MRDLGLYIDGWPKLPEPIPDADSHRTRFNQGWVFPNIRGTFKAGYRAIHGLRSFGNLEVCGPQDMPV